MLILKETEQIVGEILNHRGLYAARAWSGFVGRWTEVTFWATRAAAMAATEKRFMECKL